MKTGVGLEKRRWINKKGQTTVHDKDSPLAAAIRAWSCSASVGGWGQGPVPMATSGPPVALSQNGKKNLNNWVVFFRPSVCLFIIKAKQLMEYTAWGEQGCRVYKTGCVSTNTLKHTWVKAGTNVSAHRHWVASMFVDPHVKSGETLTGLSGWSTSTALSSGSDRTFNASTSKRKYLTV